MLGISAREEGRKARSVTLRTKQNQGEEKMENTGMLSLSLSRKKRIKIRNWNWIEKKRKTISSSSSPHTHRRHRVSIIPAEEVEGRKEHGFWWVGEKENFS